MTVVSTRFRGVVSSPLERGTTFRGELFSAIDLHQRLVWGILSRWLASRQYLGSLLVESTARICHVIEIHVLGIVLHKKKNYGEKCNVTNK